MITFDTRRCQSDGVKRVVNPKQCAAYMRNGSNPIDLYVGYDGTLVFVFDAEQTKELYQKWLLHELK